MKKQIPKYLLFDYFLILNTVTDCGEKVYSKVLPFACSDDSLGDTFSGLSKSFISSIPQPERVYTCAEILYAFSSVICEEVSFS